MAEPLDVSVVIFCKDNVFSDRYSPSGLGNARKFGEVSLYSMREHDLNVLYGADIPEEKLSTNLNIVE